MTYETKYATIAPINNIPITIVKAKLNHRAASDAESIAPSSSSTTSPPYI